MAQFQKSRRRKHLYREGAEPKMKREFEARYGKKKGDYVYGATVGKVKRERLANRKTGKA